MKKLIATDFDGTFFRNGKVDEYDLRQVALWRERGCKFGFVTGRGSDFFTTLRELGVDADFVIVYNGSLVADFDGNTLFEAFIHREDFVKIQQYFEAAPNVSSFSKATDEELYRHYYASYETSAEALKAAAEINELYGDKITAFVNGVHVNIGARGTGKSQGVAFILDYYGFGADEGAAVGDDRNDLQMILDHDGWTVDTACDEIKAKAPHICGGIGDLVKTLLDNDAIS